MHERFSYASLQDVRDKAKQVSAWLPLREDLSSLSRPLMVEGKRVKNRIAIQPMEGSDGHTDGSPGELTNRRYLRFAKGGAGLIWFEAVAVEPKGRASARQLMLTDQNVDAFKRLVESIRETSLRENGYAPLLIMQATQSGRYAKPTGSPEPQIVYNNPCLEDTPLPPSCILSDDEIQAKEALFGKTAKLAQEAGFDGIDIKACHRYLISELLSAYCRDGKYGGSFENRTRFLKNVYHSVKASSPSAFIVTSRMNVYDGFPYPYGFGVAEGEGLSPFLEEAKRLVGMLRQELRVPILNITIGNPYRNPHVNRPYDQGNYMPEEHPLVGVSRMMRCVSEIQKECPDLPVIGSAFSYLRKFSGALAAGMVDGGHASLAGFGRLSFAYPDFPKDLLTKGALDPSKVCVTCGKCAALLRAGGPSGCGVRDERYRTIGV